jgi:hypothetical protein
MKRILEVKGGGLVREMVSLVESKSTRLGDSYPFAVSLLTIWELISRKGQDFFLSRAFRVIKEYHG